MQKPLPQPLRVVQLENKSGCLYMELNGEPKSPRHIDLYLTVSFKEDWDSFLGGQIKFGLKSAKLKLKLTNGVMPYESRKLTGSRQLLIHKDRQNREVNKYQNPRDFDAVLSEIKAKAKANGTGEQTADMMNKFGVTAYQVTTQGEPENPSWTFTKERSQPVLIGVSYREKLGTLYVTKKPCIVTGFFEVSKKDVLLRDIQGLGLEDIHSNKRVVLNTMITQWLIDAKLTPYLSQAVLLYD